MIFQSHHNSLIKLGHFGFEFWRILGDHSVIVQTWFRALIMLLPLINLIFSWSFLFIYFIYLFMFYSALSMFCCREKLCIYAICVVLFGYFNYEQWLGCRWMHSIWMVRKWKEICYFLYVFDLFGWWESEGKWSKILFNYFLVFY